MNSRNNTNGKNAMAGEEGFPCLCLPRRTQRLHIEVRGVVQGVGFRPFLHRLALSQGIRGWARNTLSGVELEAEGAPEDLRAFLGEIRESPPPRARVEELVFGEPLPPAGYGEFSILPSRAAPGEEEGLLVPPDTAVCPSCRRELLDPGDRRYRYPFINCTDCGPRFTIIEDMPYDRERTSMKGFSMCPACREEYGDIGSRRYHAQPDCCPACGPRAFFCGPGGEELPGDPISLAQRALGEGKVVAVKGLGGFHLACDAENEEAVRLLRARKRREEKPLALMCRDLETARLFCRISPREEALLQGPEGPIVLLEKRDPEAFPFLSANNRLGILLPYTPLHILLLDGSSGGPRALVMTSANPPHRPVYLGNREALAGLSGIAEGFLLHNRPIRNRCDDSLLMEWQGREYFFRRSRGYAPGPVSLSRSAEGVVAFGAEQKASFCIGRGPYAFPSQHIGDLKNLETFDHYWSNLKTYLRLFRVEPSCLACDLHPDFVSTREAAAWAEWDALPLIRVQHHWAHMASCMEDNGLSGPAFGVVWDGTGLGAEGGVWGGEFLLGDLCGFRRVGSVRPLLLPGGEAAIREIGRTALSLLWEGGLEPGKGPFAPEKQRLLFSMLEKGTACVPASSVGRLFDGVYSLITGREKAAYEGQGAVLLEALARKEIPGLSYPVAFYEEEGIRRFDYRPLIRSLWADVRRGAPAAAVARGFMDALCRMALEQCRALNGEGLPVVLSGGVFLNRYILGETFRLLSEDGYRVYTHHRVSPGDEGISLGQLAVAAAMRERELKKQKKQSAPKTGN